MSDGYDFMLARAQREWADEQDEMQRRDEEEEKERLEVLLEKLADVLTEEEFILIERNLRF